MSYLYPKREKKQAVITRDEWYNLMNQFIDLTDELADCDKAVKEQAGKLAEAIFKLGNKGNWR